MAAVRAVESGERSAAEFFPAPEPARPPRRAPAPVPRGGPAGGGPAGGRPANGPVPVPEELRQALADGGAPQALGEPAARALGPQAAQELREDPWRLLAVDGVRPEQADAFAAALGEEEGPAGSRRVQALTGWLLERAARAGHTVLESATVAEGLARHGVPEPEEAVREAVDAGAVLVFRAEPQDAGADGTAGEEEAAQPQDAVPLLLGLERWALAEESLADGLHRLQSTFAVPAGADGRAWTSAADAAPSPSAAALIRAAGGSALVVHTGGEASRAEPAALVAAARAAGLRACAAAHTEDGRRRLAQLVAAAQEAYPAAPSPPEAEDGAEAPTGAEAAVTVAGLLAGREGPGHDEDGALALDVLAVLDAPLLDAEAAAALVEALPDGARLVLSGDPQLLGPAGAGQVLADVLAARVCPHVASRTPDPGPLGELVSGVGAGELPQVAAPGKEVVIVPVREAAEAVHRTVQLVADSVPRALGIEAAHTQVIVPGHGGGAGTGTLNAALKARLNPGPGRFGGFDPGDRVAYAAVPGRTVLATVSGADESGLRLATPDGAVTVARDRVAASVRHGWAVTAHQAAGHRWPAAVVVLPGDAAQALDRSWVYTAFGRAERHLSVVHGVADALPRAVAERPGPVRATRLRTLLRPQPEPRTDPA
ncbi:helix-hairpin-helix domain-containing protein [Streptomyces sp. TRM 70351]|uniref:helix-hairpin-helix domain-containing protein n=1 Tax=Streptomyces sp. TRM 70351 TaxID=3116552 RepID=UPI002E7C047E|nr:helix-hairpin-helix domain-containing protein [Streptomyces sp. TRM 70351]MEE1929200.1 helix-hairpin-helix domain-containing protein [Streptomyces sp. TRM 70351]